MSARLHKNEHPLTASRHAGLKTFEFNGRMEIEPRDTIDLTEEQRAIVCETYIVQEGDRIDNLAAEMCGDSRLGWLIVELNPLEISDPLVLTPGATVWIPTLDFASRFL